MTNNNNILALGNSGEGIEELLALVKESIQIQSDILVETRLTNEYLKVVTNEEFTPLDIC
jgi:hypothetical protein